MDANQALDRVYKSALYTSGRPWKKRAQTRKNPAFFRAKNFTALFSRQHFSRQKSKMATAHAQSWPQTGPYTTTTQPLSKKQ